MFSLVKSACLFTLCLVCNAAFAGQLIIPPAPEVNARSYLLIDADTGTVLVEKNADQPMAPASLTKLMTAYIVIDGIETGRYSDNDKVLISDNAWKKGGAKSGGSTMFLDPRTEVSIIDLLRGVVIQSGNDASIALAEHVAGSEEGFAFVMNEQAKLLGMNNTNFVNSTGWPHQDHKTTAMDLAILARAVVNDHPDYYPLYSEKSFTYNEIKQGNRNKLLFSNKYVDGLKTGHTEEAGYCLVASAKQNGTRLISVVLGTDTKQARAAESQRLLVYGFRNFQNYKMFDRSKVLSTRRVWGGKENDLDLTVKDSVIVTIPRDSQSNLEAEMQFDKVIKAPIKKGQVLGKLIVSLGEKQVAEQDLVAVVDVEKAGMFGRFWDWIVLNVAGE